MMLLLPFVALALVAQDSPEPIPAWIRAQEGRSCRVDSVGPTGKPGAAAMFRTMDEARAYSIKAQDLADARAEADPSGLVLIGHNTHVTCTRLYAWRDDLGRLHCIAEVTIDTGTLQGDRAWMAARRLRLERDPDRARHPGEPKPAPPPRGRRSALGTDRPAGRATVPDEDIGHEIRAILRAGGDPFP